MIIKIMIIATGVAMAAGLVARGHFGEAAALGAVALPIVAFSVRAL